MAIAASGVGIMTSIRIPPQQSDNPMPPESFRRDLAEAVHHGVCQATGTDGYHQCLYYSFAGAIIANAITKRLYDYEVVAGSSRLWFSRKLGRCWFKDQGYHIYDKEPTDVDCFWVEHVWVVGWGKDDLCRSEIMDLSTRHYKAYFRRRWGMEWEWSPEWFWDWFDILPMPGAQHWYEQKQYVIDDIRRLADENNNVVCRTVEIATKQLQHKGYAIDTNLFECVR